MSHSVAEYYSVIRRNKELGLLQRPDNPSTQDVAVKGSVGTISCPQLGSCPTFLPEWSGQTARVQTRVLCCQFQIRNLKMGLNPLRTDCHAGFRRRRFEVLVPMSTPESSPRLPEQQVSRLCVSTSRVVSSEEFPP